MTLTERDRKMLMAIVPLVIILAYWFLLLSPKRQEASTTSETLSSEQAKLTDAQSSASTLSAAKTNFASDYAAVIKLGKAIPASVDMPSLLVQLEQAAHGTGISFEKVTVGERISSTEAAAAAPPVTGAAPAPTAPSGEAPGSAPGEAAATAQGATDAANESSTASADAASGDPTAAPAATSSAPGAAPALESVPLDFSFKGSFFELANLFHKLKRFVYVAGDNVRVRGRLMTIDSVQYTTDPATFPDLAATVHATVYLTPKAEGIAAGATPSGPPPAPAPSTSTASSDGSAVPPAPTATATP